MGGEALGDEEPLRRSQLERLRRFVGVRAGLVLDASKDASLREAAEVVRRAFGLADVGAVLEACQASDSRPFARLIEQLTVIETYFFRNRPHFRALDELVFPELLERQAESRSLRIWSAGCSTGEEPYSLAMTLSGVAQRLGVRLDDWSLTITGTDINEAALTRAREARYGRYSFRGVRDEELTRFFDSDEDEECVKTEYRDMVDFKAFNLKQDTFPSANSSLQALDLIVCRNVTIYFSEETTQSVADGFYSALNEGGYLIVGHTEHSLKTYRRFETHALPDAVLYRRGGGTTAPPESESRRVVPPLTDLPDVIATAPPAAHRLVERETVSPTQPPPSIVVPPGCEEGLDAARGALAEGEPDRAASLALAVLERQPDDADACLFLGEMAADRGNRLEAEIWLKRCVEIRPLDLTAHHVLALLATEGGRRAEALGWVQKALFLDPRFIMGLSLAARLHAELGEEAEARSHRQTALRVLSSLPLTAEVPLSRGLSVAELRALLGKLP